MSNLADSEQLRLIFEKLADSLFSVVNNNGNTIHIAAAKDIESSSAKVSQNDADIHKNNWNKVKAKLAAAQRDNGALLVDKNKYKAILIQHGIAIP